jgi:hypothetical protein
MSTQHYSLILTSISIFCLLVTLFTYAVLGELRNLPGLNLIALSTTILAYQVLQYENLQS